MGSNNSIRLSEIKAFLKEQGVNLEENGTEEFINSCFTASDTRNEAGELTEGGDEMLTGLEKGMFLKKLFDKIGWQYQQWDIDKLFKERDDKSVTRYSIESNDDYNISISKQDLETADEVTTYYNDNGEKIKEYFQIDGRYYDIEYLPKIPDFKPHQFVIKRENQRPIHINAYVAEALDEESAKAMTDKLNTALQNMPEKVLNDLQNECKVIFINEKIDHEERAWGLAIGEIDQMYLSTLKMKDLSDESFEVTLVHELGHLIDATHVMGRTARETDKYIQDFAELKELMTEDLGFNVKSHTLDKVGEFFADYYLGKNYELDESHRAKNIFDMLNTYSQECKTLSDDELKAKYPEKFEQIKTLVEIYDKISSGFDEYLGEIQYKGDGTRTGYAKPMTLKHILDKKS